MQQNYGRDLDLNLLRVFAVVAGEASVTQAAAKLYLTQPAVSAALKRLSVAVGAPLFAKEGRGLVLTARGERLFATIRPHLEALVDASFAAPTFDPRTSDRKIRLGLADASELWLLPRLLRALEKKAPRLGIVAVPVNFRTVGDALRARKVDVALTVADELPSGVRREPFAAGGFSLLFDPRKRKGARITEKAYFEASHVLVSYNGDFRGVVEETLGRERRVRCSVSSFHAVGDIVEGSSMLATVPTIVARAIVERRPRLRLAPLPFAFPVPAQGLEMIWPEATDDDGACRFVRDEMRSIVAAFRKRAA